MRVDACFAAGMLALAGWIGPRGTEAQPSSGSDRPFAGVLASDPVESSGSEVGDPGPQSRPLEVERVLAVVNGVPILLSDVELAVIAELVPRTEDEGDEEFENTVVEALVALELRWRNLEAAGIPGRTRVDLNVAWQRVVERTGGEAQLRAALQARSLLESDLRQLVRRAAVVEAYVASRFAPFIRPTAEEVEAVWLEELRPRLLAEGHDAESLEPYRQPLEQLVRERKLETEIRRWTEELEQRGDVVRYRR